MEHPQQRHFRGRTAQDVRGSPSRRKEEHVKRKITIKEFSKELVARIDASKGIDCCKEEIKKLARLAAKKLPDEKLLVTWKEA